jgi:PHP family Zn ribbon phosphoesterase
MVMNKKEIIKKISNILKGYVICKNCRWNWEIESDDKNPHLCHKCGFDNEKNVFDCEELDNWKREKSK